MISQVIQAIQLVFRPCLLFMLNTFSMAYLDAQKEPTGLIDVKKGYDVNCIGVRGDRQRLVWEDAELYYAEWWCCQGRAPTCSDTATRVNRFNFRILALLQT